jgi:chemotaxis protein MotB
MKVEERIEASPKLAPMASQLKLDMTRDGPAHPDRRRTQPPDVRQRLGRSCKPYMRELLREIGVGAGRGAEPPHARRPHRRQPFSGGERGYSNWELSADRANASRRELLAGGLPDDRVLRVQGLASSRSSIAHDPLRREQPPHQHHRDEPRRRGPLFRTRPTGADP